MLMRLSRNAFIREYGPYTYIRDRHGNQDYMFKDAAPFFKHIDRTPHDESEIIARITAEFENCDIATIRSDFAAMIDPLVEHGLIVRGKSSEELNGVDRVWFSYGKDEACLTDEEGSPVTEAEFMGMPQCILGDYFRKNPTLFDLQLDITQACTERCIHCYVPEYNSLFLPYDKSCEVMREFRTMGGLMIGFSGGECMMHPDFKRLIEFARTQDLIASVLSNLTLCDDSMVHFLKDNQAFVQVSLYSMNSTIHDGITQRKGSWAKTKSAIERLHDADVPIRISCPTMRQNYDGYLDVLKYAEGLHIPAQTDFIMMAKADHDKSNLDNRLSLAQTKSLLEMVINDNLPAESEYFDPKHKEDLKTPEERSEEPLCGAGVDKLCLNANGNYYPCSGFQDYAVGNCFKQSLRDVWENSPRLRYIRGLRGKDISKCIHCENRNYCSMCLVRNYNETGDMLKVADHFCKVAALNREVVEDFHRKLINRAKLQKEGRRYDM